MNKIKDKKIYEMISKIIREPVTKINKNSKSCDYEKWDSIAQVRIFVELEKLLNKKIETKYMEKLQSIKKILEFIKKNN
jgi:acyl carrier protein